MLDAAKAVRLFKNSVEHRGEIAGRRIDVLKHLCQGRLAGQCFVALRGPRLELLPKCRYRLPEINVRIVGHRLLAPDDTLVPPALPASTRLALVDRRSKCSQFLPRPAVRGEVGIRAVRRCWVRGKRPAHNSPSPRPSPRKRARENCVSPTELVKELPIGWSGTVRSVYREASRWDQKPPAARDQPARTAVAIR